MGRLFFCVGTAGGNWCSSYSVQEGVAPQGWLYDTREYVRKGFVKVAGGMDMVPPFFEGFLISEL